MMRMTKDGQLHPGLLAKRDKRFDISTAEKKKNREDILMPNVDPVGKGEIRQFIITNNADSGVHKHQCPPSPAKN